MTGKREAHRKYTKVYRGIPQYTDGTEVEVEAEKEEEKEKEGEK